MNDRLAVFDVSPTAPHVADKFTVIHGEAVYTMSEDAIAPNGVNMCADEEMGAVGRAIGDRVPLSGLPAGVLVAIIRRLVDEEPW